MSRIRKTSFSFEPLLSVFTQAVPFFHFTVNLSNTLNFLRGHGIMNTSGHLQS